MRWEERLGWLYFGLLGFLFPDRAAAEFSDYMLDAWMVTAMRERKQREKAAA